MLGLNFVVGHDLIVLHLSRVVCFRGFDVVVFLLDSVEALHLMLLQRKGLSSFGRHVLDEANHGFAALRVEFVVIS